MSAFPIVYIRGYAMTSSDVEETFNMPYYGFNVGSTQIRVSKDETPSLRIFESPVVRLIKDEGYIDAFNRHVDASNRPIPGSVAKAGDDWRRTLWVFRFYDVESRLLGGKRGEIEDYAEALAVFLDGVRTACGRPDDFRVDLVAHSMGGLIARCYLQNPRLFRRKEKALRTIRPLVTVNRLFTYGTPHRGISFRRGLGWVENVRDLLGVAGSETFGEKRMRAFLALPKNVDLYTYRPLRHAPALQRVFCLVGTNYQDYVVWASRKAAGPGSDGLVLVENAYVRGAARAFVHRAHSGPFGIVNSEEGYQNLSRFLFGDIRYEAALEPVDVIRDLPGLEAEDELEHLEIEIDLAIRGLPIHIQTRKGQHQSAIVLRMTRRAGGFAQEKRVATPLFTGYLRCSKKLKGDPLMRCAFQIRIVPHYRHAGWIRASRLEGEALLNDSLIVGCPRSASAATIEYRWSTLTRNRKVRSKNGAFLIPLPGAAARYLRSRGIGIRLSPWGD